MHLLGRISPASKRRKLLFLVFCALFLLLLLYGDRLLLVIKPSKLNAAEITWSDSTLRNILVNDTVSQQLKKDVRILCVVPSTANNEATKARAVNNTWGARCNKLLFVFGNHRSVFNHISLNMTDSRSILTAKTMEAFTYVHKHYADQYDWVVKADDDSYLILENLRLLLSKFNPNEPAYLGYHFQVHIHNGYMSGGGSYVLSKTALRMLVEKGLKAGCAVSPNDEDLEVGRCMEKLGVKPYATQDKFGRDAFHPQLMEQHMVGPMPWYLSHYPAVPIKAGPECCSQFSISFHYVPPDMMYIVDFLLYRVSVYGTVQLPADQLGDVFVKKVSEIKHNTKDEIIHIKSYRTGDYIPQIHGHDEDKSR